MDGREPGEIATHELWLGQRSYMRFRSLPESNGGEATKPRSDDCFASAQSSSDFARPPRKSCCVSRFARRIWTSEKWMEVRFLDPAPMAESMRGKNWAKSQHASAYSASSITCGFVRRLKALGVKQRNRKAAFESPPRYPLDESTTHRLRPYRIEDP